MANPQATKVKANGVVYDLVDTAARASIASAIAEVEKATARVEAIAPLNYPLVYTPTADTTKQAGKFYYTYAGDGQYSEFKGSTFDTGVTYYEIDQTVEKTPQVKVDSVMSGEMSGAWDTKKFVTGAGVAIGHHARALNEDDGWNWNVAIGQNATAGDGIAGDQACAIGEQSVASKYSCTAIGSKAKASEYGACAVGWGSSAQGIRSVCIGNNAVASVNAAGAIMLGPGTNTEPSTVYVGVSDVAFSKVPTATHTTFQHGQSYFIKDASDRYVKYNCVEGDPIPTDPQIYIMGSVNAKTYKLLDKEGIVPAARLPIGSNVISASPASTVNITPTHNYSNLILPASGSFAANTKFNITIDPDRTNFSAELMFVGSCSNFQFVFVAKTGKTDTIKYVGSTSNLTTTLAGIVSIRSIESGSTRYIIVKIEG